MMTRQKTSLYLPDRDRERLRTVAERRGVTQTEVVRRGIALELLVEETTDNGGKVLIQDARGHLRDVTPL